MRAKINIYLLLLLGLSNSLSSFAQGDNKTPFGKIAKEESLVPIRPGIPGKAPFWNGYAKRFIYAPAFNYKSIPHAARYRYEIFCLSDSSTYTFENRTPYASLSPVWGKMPVSYFNLKVTGISVNGDSLGLAGSGHYYHAAFFDGPYYKPVMPYDSSAMIALDHLMHAGYVNYWLIHQAPDPNYENYKYPNKMYGALISGAVAYAKLKPNSSEAIRAKKIAVIVANRLMEISFPKGSPWEYCPPTYYGEWIAKTKGDLPYIRLDNFMPFSAVEAGNAYLDLYDITHHKKYLVAAELIARTFLKNQLDNGSWYLFVKHATGEPTSKNILIPTMIINYFDRLRRDYGVKGLEAATNKSFNYIMNGPVKTYNWHGQFEDVGSRPPYSDQSKTQACELAIYLFKNGKNNPYYLKLAEELLRFTEDQFVIWSNPRHIPGWPNQPGRNTETWVTPCATEQYLYWMPVNISSMFVAKTYWYAYTATGKEIYLAKARTLANAMTLVQKEANGIYPTYFTLYQKDRWLNCDMRSAHVMFFLADEMKKKGLKMD
jgi:maltose/maltodextrin transport system substrate-binding protein